MKDRGKTGWLNESLLLILYVTIVIAIALPRSLFGFDMEDEGWALTTFQNMFSAPWSVSSTFLCYNGMLVGGLWNLLFGQYGLLAFRILYVIGEVLKALLVYLILRKYCNRFAIFAGFIMLECVYRADVYMDHYQITGILCLLTILFIIKSLEKQEWLYMLLAGIIVGINVFTRLSNIVFCAFILVVAIYWYHTRDARTSLQMLFAAIGGFIAGCVAEILLMSLMGHFSLFLNEVAGGFSASADSDSSHSLGALGTTYFNQLVKKIWLHTAIMGCAAGIFVAVKKKVKPWNSKAYILLTGILVLAVMALAYYQFTSIGGAALIAVQTLICAYVIYKAPYDVKYVAVLALLLLYTLPLGCDWGYDSKITCHAMCLSLPMTAAWLLQEISLKNALQNIRKNILLLPMGMLMLVIGGYSAFIGGFTSYVGYKNIAAIRHGQSGSIHSPRATTYILGDYLPTRLNPLLDEMAKYVKEGDVVLCFQSPAMIHYLTATRPYLNNPWPWTYTPAEMERRFRKIQATTDVLPVIVREKGWVRDIFNDRVYPDWNNSEAVENHWHKNKRIKLLQDFIRDNGYNVVWEDQAFQILLPPTMQQSDSLRSNAASLSVNYPSEGRWNVFKRELFFAKRAITQRDRYDYPAESNGWHKVTCKPVYGDWQTGSIFDPHVIEHDGALLMSASERNTGSIILLRSTDAIHWQKECVLLPPASHTWEEDVNRSCLRHIDGKWHLWYTGQQNKRSAIGYLVADSYDNFQRPENNQPILFPEMPAEGESVMNPCVVWDDSLQLFRIWYAAGEDYEPDRLFYAESKDGNVWHKQPQPVLEKEPNHPWEKYKVGGCDVTRLADGTYEMYYIGYQNVDVARICYATSADGIHWLRSDSNYCLAPSPNSWDADAVYKPAYLKYNGQHYLWYNGRSGMQEYIGMAQKDGAL